MESAKTQKPLALKPGDAIAVVAPASAPVTGPLKEGLGLLESWGYEVCPVGLEDAGDEYLSGEDSVRTARYLAALGDQRFKAVWFARGGYGSVRVLAHLRAHGLGDYPQRVPPLVVGFSDVSLLLASLSQRAGWACLHGPNVTTLARMSEKWQTELRRQLGGGYVPGVSGLEEVVGGTGEGPLLVMNLCILCSVIGTPLAPDLRGRLLVLEDVSESPYRLDRLFMQLSLSRDFGRLAGLILGDLDGGWRSSRLRKTVTELCQGAGISCAFGAPLGHGVQQRTLPLGLRARLDVAAGTLDILEPLFGP
jgi:muramoyltetrapeptide carboxypeptidase